MPDFQPGVTVITCTGDRPESFERCCQLVARQEIPESYRQRLQWIVVNDGFSGPDGWEPWMVRAGGVAPDAVARIDALSSFGEALGLFRWPVECVNPSPKWLPGQNTLARNLLAAIPRVLYDKVLFMEDDDWYAPDYVQTMADFLETSKLVGDPVSNYYHVPSRRFRIMKNQACASLAQTGIRAELLPALADVCRSPQFIDLMLWQVLRHERSMLPVQRVVGMKGLPGRPGIGVGHQPDRNPGLWTPDPALSTLRSWIGDDAKLYQEFMK